MSICEEDLHGVHQSRAGGKIQGIWVRIHLTKLLSFAQIHGYCSQKVAMPFQGIPGGFIKKKSQDQLRWIGLHRSCGLGNPGNLKPCGSHRCLLCSILQASYDSEKYGDGVMTTNLPRYRNIVLVYLFILIFCFISIIGR